MSYMFQGPSALGPAAVGQAPPNQVVESNAKLIQSCATKYGLVLDTVSHKKYGESKTKPVDVWRQWLVDLTIQNKATSDRLPIIRAANVNLSDRSWKTNINELSVIVGNQIVQLSPNAQMQTKESIPLTQYLSNLNSYFSKSSQPQTTTLNVSSKTDETVMVTQQWCVLEQSATDYHLSPTVVNYLPYTKTNSGPLLCILATEEGTSATIVRDSEEILAANLFGRKGDILFTPQQQLQQRNTNRVITMICVPLKSSLRTVQQKSRWFFFSSGSTPDAANKSEESEKKLDELTKLWLDKDESSSYASQMPYGSTVAPYADPLCLCGLPLKKVDATECYENTGVNCDGCSKNVTDFVYHCPNGKSDKHGNGFDFCSQCAVKQLVFDELNGCEFGSIVRDETLPIRVVFQHFAFVPPNDARNASLSSVDSLMSTVASQLVPRKQPTAAVPAVSPPKPPAPMKMVQPMMAQPMMAQPSPVRPNPPTMAPLQTTPMQIAPMQSSALQTPIQSSPVSFTYSKSCDVVKRVLNNLEMSGYIKVFAENEIFDHDLLFMREGEVTRLVDKVGPRLRFLAWLEQFQRQNADFRSQVQNALKYM